MEKVGKIKTITRAFTETSEIDVNILKKRREICSKCEFNSLNAKNKDLSLIDKARKKLIENEPFCVPCGCQIKEKTAQETEECGATSNNLPAKWNRIKLETVSKFDLDLVNLSPDMVNIDLSVNKKYYEIDFGNTKKLDIKKLKFLIKSREDLPLKIKHISPSCGSCTFLDFKKVNNNTYEVDVELNTSNISNIKFVKQLYVGYFIGETYKKGTIKMIGQLKKD